MSYTYTAPNAKYLSESLRKAVLSDEFMQSPLTTAVISQDLSLDLEKAVHVLVAGCTGSGKSVCLHNIISSLLVRNTPATAQFLLIDPKIIEFEFFYRDNPCLFCPVVTDPEEAVNRLESACREMMRRYDAIRAEGKRMWTGKRLYIVIDEIADLVSTGGKRLERIIEKIARLGRGAGIHLIVATQHPTADVLSRQITANLDTRICLSVIDSSASRLILGKSGGEQLKGKGDAIVRINSEFIHTRCAYNSDEDLTRFAHSWKLEYQDPEPVTETFCLNA